MIPKRLRKYMDRGDIGLEQVLVIVILVVLIIILIRQIR